MSGPVWYEWARGELGTREVPGKGSNARVLAYRSLAKLGGIKGDDSVIAWCSIFVGAAMETHKIRGTRSGMARSWAKWGVALPGPVLGCVVPLWRGSMSSSLGHVGFYAGQTKDGSRVLLLGGNQGDAVSFAWVDAKRVLGWRWPSNVPVPSPFPKPVVLAPGVPGKPVKES